MTNHLDHSAREQLFASKKAELLRSAREFLAAAAWLTSDFNDIVQRPNIDDARSHIEKDEWEQAKKFNGESWYSRLSQDEYAVLREVAEMVVLLSPDIAIDAAVTFLQKGDADDYFELRLSESGFKRVRFDKP